MIAVSRRQVWIVLAGGIALLGWGMVHAGIALDLAAGWGVLVVLAAALSLPLWLRPTTDRQARLSDALECAALFSLVSMVGALASYVVAGGSRGYTDGTLAAMDRAMGFDWIALYGWFADNPVAATIAKFAYLSIFVTPVMVMFALGLAGQAARARQFLAAFAVALAIALVCFHFFPARSALVGHLGERIGYMPAAGTQHIAVIEAARAGTLAPVDPTQLAGIITFPSFHAVMAMLFVWAAWPVRAIRWPIAVVNAAMIVATPIQGTHYLIDLIAGAGVALVSVAWLYTPLIVSRRRRRTVAGGTASARSEPEPVPG